MALTLERDGTGGYEDLPGGFPARPVAKESITGRVILAALLLGPAVIHFGMIPSHSSASTTEAILFAFAGWIGVGLAGAALLKPSHRLWTLTAVANAAFVVVWAISRTTGLPFGAHAGHAESATSIDLLTVAMESLAVIWCVALIARPALLSFGGSAGRYVGGLVGAGAIVASSLALISPAAQNHSEKGHAAETAGDAAATDGHAHTDAPVAVAAAGAEVTAADGHAHTDAPATTIASAAAGPVTTVSDGHAHPPSPVAGDATATTAAHAHAATAPAVAASALASRCDLALNPVSFWNETMIVNQGAADPSKVTDTPGLLTLKEATLAAGGERKDAAVISALGNASDADYNAWVNWLPTYHASSGAHAKAGAVDDNGGHGGHLGPQPWVPMTNKAECDQLTKELEQARAIALQYPHPTDAEAAGWRRITAFVPGIAAHYIKASYLDAKFELDKPEMLLYDGTGPNASILGLSYLLAHPGDTEPDQGFTGPNDHYHRHEGLCVGAKGVVGDSTLTAQECAARGGIKATGIGLWMNHVWLIPGCESPWGVFSGASPTLDDSLALASGTDGGACKGTALNARFNLTPGSPTNVPPALVGK